MGMRGDCFYAGRDCGVYDVQAYHLLLLDGRLVCEECANRIIIAMSAPPAQWVPPSPPPNMPNIISLSEYRAKRHK